MIEAWSRTWKRFLSAPPAILFVVLASFGVSVARAMSLTFVAIVLQRDFAMEPMAIGLTLGLGPLLGAIAAPIAGAWSDAIGRKAILVLLLATLCLATIVLGLTDDLFVYLAAYTMATIAVSLFGPMVRAIIGDAAIQDERLGYFSWRYTASNLGWAIGPVAGTLAGTAIPTGFLAAGTVYGALLAVLFTLELPLPSRPETSPREQAGLIAALRTVSGDRRLLLFIVGGTLILAVYSHWQATMGAYLLPIERNGTTRFAILVSINGVVVLLANPVIRALVARTGGRTGMIIGCAFLVAGQGGFAASVALPALALAMVLLSVGEVLVVQSEYMLIDARASASNRGSYFGAQGFTVVGNFLGPVLGGILLATAGGTAMFLSFTALAIVSGALFIAATSGAPTHGNPTG
jgi:MFS family permease